MKKILVLGGAQVHCKLVEAAHELNLYVIVTDYLNFEESPCKKIADKSYDIDINNIDEIVEMCEQEQIDAIISTHLDPCQIPYQKICERLHLPCLGTKRQFEIMTNKSEFKKVCKSYGVECVPEFELDDSNITFPVFVKPVDSRGSRGQTCCYNKEQLKVATDIAMQVSASNSYIIEKYYENYPEIQVTYYFVNGQPFLLRTTDSYKGSIENNLGNVIRDSISPSKYTKNFLMKTHKKIIEMLQGIGIKNGPVMLQGFMIDDECYFFDQGLRFPGVDYERIYKQEYNIDLLIPLITFSLTGEMPNVNIDEDSMFLHGKCVRIVFPLLSTGIIATIEGMDKLSLVKGVSSVVQRHFIGDTIRWSHDINHRLAEIDVIGDDQIDIQQKVSEIYGILKVKDHDGTNMLIKTDIDLFSR